MKVALIIIQLSKCTNDSYHIINKYLIIIIIMKY